MRRSLRPISRRLHPLLVPLACLLACAGLAACAVQSEYGKSAAGELVLQSTVVVPACTNTQGVASSVVHACSFVDAASAQSSIAIIVLTGLSAEDDVQLVPVLILEVPQGATDFAATFDNGRGKTGRMLVTSGLAVLPVDSRTSMVAEPGTQLVLLELPGDAGPDAYATALSFTVAPPQLKVMSAAKVAATGSTYYAPLLPCTPGFEALPFVPVRATATASLIDSASIASAYGGCKGMTYTYTSVPPRATIATVYEYYNASLDHYFITWTPTEIDALDRGAVRGWQRTGKSFPVYVTPEAGTSPVCRYYMPPQYGDSHFFGRGAQECADTGRRNPGFVLEDPAFMYVTLPTSGTCASGMQPIYRVFSNRPDANHRYTTDAAVRDSMVARGWIAEGDGPGLIVMCGPLS